MSDRRNFERLLVPSESLQPAVPGEPAAVPNEITDDTQPMRLSFLALLAERDPAVQARLERRRTLALEDELEDDEDRPTDPMIVVGR